MGKERKTGGLLGTIERVGNMLPHPFILFLYIIAALAVLSTVLSLLGVSAVNPTTGELVEVQNIISRDGLVWIVENMLTNFSTFAPLGLVLAMQMAIGLAEGAGLLDTFMRRAILGVPLWALSATVLFLGINGSIASEASIIVIPALAATAFQAMGKHPIAGLIAGYAATNAGFTANVLITATDALLYGVTEEAAHLIDTSVKLTPAINWYFMIVSTFLLTAVGVFVNDRIMGRIRIVKTDSLTGKPLAGAVFTVTRLSGPASDHAADVGKVVATLTTNAQGIAETGLLPWGEYKITETGVPDGYLDAGYTANAWIK